MVVPKKTKAKASHIDVIVGKNLMLLRKTNNVSQIKLAKTIGISFQQLQKYENGDNRVSAATLYNLTKFSGVKMEDFFYGLDFTKEKDHGIASLFHSIDKETLEMALLFQSVASKEIKQALLKILTSMTGDS